ADGLPKEETPAEIAEEAPPEENPPDTFSDESALPPDEAEEPSPESSSEEGAPPDQPILDESPPAPEDLSLSSKPGADFWGSLSSGAIVSELKPAGKIVGANDKDLKTMYGEGDLVYLVSTENPVPPQKEWVVFKDIKKIYHPKSGEYLGNLVVVLGMVKAVEASGKMTTGRVTHSNLPIQKGDPIISVENLIGQVPAGVRSPSEKKGVIVESNENHINSGLLDIVYIDQGKNEGVAAGDKFEIIHETTEGSLNLEGERVPFPPRKVGSLVVLSAQSHTATARIVRSSEPILKGDPVFYLP
ncbi:MAG TPA: hypothetical protein VIK48_01615, partial [Candidatus Manganitrophaceae bacterium]